MSFSPFFGGPRICAGKTFAHFALKLYLAEILLKYEYDFEDKSIYEKKPILNVDIDREPEIIFTIKDRN